MSYDPEQETHVAGREFRRILMRALPACAALLPQFVRGAGRISRAVAQIAGLAHGMQPRRLEKPKKNKSCKIK